LEKKLRQYNCWAPLSVALFNYTEMKKIFSIPVIATFITILAAVGVFMFLKFQTYLKANIDLELFKYCFQFLLLVVIGGAVTLLFTSYTKLRDEKIKAKEKEN
jgi:hypothetical protein